MREIIINADDNLSLRAWKLAQLAFADFANDRDGMTDRAAWRIVQALEKYKEFDDLKKEG